MVGSGWSVMRCANAMLGARPAATAPAAAPIKVLRLRKRCSGVARLSGISQPRRRMMFMGLIPPEWLWKQYGHAASQTSHGCGSNDSPGTSTFLNVAAVSLPLSLQGGEGSALAEATRLHSAARLAATIWSAVLPVSSAMWSNLKVNEP